MGSRPLGLLASSLGKDSVCSGQGLPGWDGTASAAGALASPGVWAGAGGIKDEVARAFRPQSRPRGLCSHWLTEVLPPAFSPAQFPPRETEGEKEWD